MFYRGASRCRCRPSSIVALPRFVVAGGRPSSLTSTPPFSAPTSPPSAIAASSASTANRRTYATARRPRSDNDGGDGGGIGTIDPKDLDALSATSAKLYRLLLRSSRSLFSSVGDEGDGGDGIEEEARLQPPLDPRDYGRARLVGIRGRLQTDEAETTAARRSLWNFVSGRLGAEGPSRSESAFVRRRFADPTGDDDADGDGSDSDSDGSDDDVESDSSVSTTSSDLRSAIRRSFFRLGDFDPSSSSSKPTLTKGDVVEMHRLAIATLRVIHEQIEMRGRTSVSTDERRGLRVIATSRCIGKTASGDGTARYRFAYRIRIENVGRRKGDDAANDADGMSEGAVQLLGRTWIIEEDGGEVVHVDAPTTGAVGHHPVILPGRAFEYMSGCELQTKTGRMSGKFHMASVDGETTPSAMVGDVVEALEAKDGLDDDDDDDAKFELAVKPFRLVADE